MKASKLMSPLILGQRLAVLTLLASGVMFLMTAMFYFSAPNGAPWWPVYVLVAFPCFVGALLFLVESPHAGKLVRFIYGGLVAFLFFKLLLFVWQATPTTVAGEVTTLLFCFLVVYTMSAVLVNKWAGLAGNLIVFAFSFLLPVVAGLFGVLPNTVFVPWPQLYVFEGAAIVLAFTVAAVREYHEQATHLADSMALLAYTDFLTGLPNRRQLFEVLAQQVRGKQRYGGEFSVILFDLDRFKHINDVFGHARGDRVLEEVARVVRASLRESDIIGRWGGEEFLVIAPHTNHQQAISLAERLREALADHAFDLTGPVTASFGVATYKPGTSLDQLLRLADKALYCAKENGRNRVEAA